MKNIIFNKFNINYKNDNCYNIKCEFCKDNYYHCISTDRVYCSCDTGLIFFYNN
jgi:hypothetical protein